MNHQPHVPSLLLAGLLTSGLAHAAAPCRQQSPPPQGKEPALAANKPPPAPIRGQLKSRYILRWTGDDADNDLVETLSVDVGNAERDAVTGHLMGRATYDFDGVDPTFASINDSYGGRFDTLLYDAYVDFHRVSGLSQARLGRQSVLETPEVAWFDGAHVTSAEFGDLALQAGGYVGSSTHLYESSKAGDLVAGAYLQTRPWRDGRLRVDYMHLEDDTRLLGHTDDLYGAGFWQSLGRYLQLDAQYSRLGDRDRDAKGRAVLRVPQMGLLVQGSYFTLLTAQGELVLEADPFFNALNELHPYDQWSLLIAKELDKHLRLQGAADLRRVRDAGDIGFYNRDYDHYYGTATLTDVGTAGLTLSATLDLWDSGDQLVRSWGADATYDIDRSSVSAGSYYSLFKYDLFTNSERDHVRTYYARLRHKTSDRLTLDGDYEFEDDDFDTYQRIRLGATWRF